MSRLSKVLLMVAIFVLVFSAGGAGQEAAAAPNAGLIGKTQITGPGEIGVTLMGDPKVTAPFLLSNNHYLYDNSNSLGLSMAPVKFPKGKIAKWAKAWVVDNSASKTICMYVWLANPNLSTLSVLGSAKCTPGGASSSIQILKTTFSQKVPAGKFVIIEFITQQSTHRIHGVQGGFLK